MAKKIVKINQKRVFANKLTISFCPKKLDGKVVGIKIDYRENIRV